MTPDVWLVFALLFLSVCVAAGIRLFFAWRKRECRVYPLSKLGREVMDTEET